MKTEKFKELLLGEKQRLLDELESVGYKSSSQTNNWEAKPTDLDSDSADENEVADEVEEMGNNSAIVEKLEIQLRDVTLALKKIQEGNYGLCEVGGEMIPEERLEANPAARTCVEHSR